MAARMKRLRQTALALAMGLAPAAAMADPGLIAFILTSSIEIAGVEIATGTILFALGSTIYSSAAARRQQRRANAELKAARLSSLQDRRFTTADPQPSWRIPYGRCLTGGDIVAIFTSDKTGYREDGTTYTRPDALKHLVIEAAHCEISDIHEVYIQGSPVGALDANGYATAGEFYVSRTDTRKVTITGSSFVDVPDAVVSILNCYFFNTADGTNGDVTPTLSIGNTRITNPNASSVTVDYTFQNNRSSVRWSKHLGDSAQTVDTYLTGVKPTEWDSTHRGRGRSHVVLTLDLEDQRFQGGPPADIQFDVSGRKVYDPRTGLTAWSDNPALIIRDWLTNVWGYNCASADIDDAYTIAAANACDTLVWIDDGAGAYQAKKYTCNGCFSTGESKESVLADLEESMAGQVPYGAQWMIQAGAWTAPVTLPGGGGLTDDDLDGQISVVQADTPMDELFNGMRGSYIPSGKTVPTDIRPPYANATFVASDGQALWRDIALPFTNSAGRARNIARILTEKARSGQVIRYPAKLRAIVLRVGDRIEVTSTEYGLAAKPYRVTDKSPGKPIMCTLQEDIAATYDEADAATADPTPNTNLPNPWSVSAITGLAATSSATTSLKSNLGVMTPRVSVTWNAVTDRYVVDGSGFIELLWRDGTLPWQQVNLPGDSTGYYIVGPKHSDRIVVEVRAVNGLGKRGPSSFLAHTVDGPASIGSVQLATEAATRVDTDSNDYAGSTFGTTTVRSFTVTPPVACTIEFSGTITANNINGDAGNKLDWYVDSGGGDVYIAGATGYNLAKQSFAVHGTLSASAGVTLTFRLKTLVTGPSIAIWLTSVRVTQIKR